MQIIWRKAARDDLTEARRYIAQHNPRAAAHIFHAIRTAVRRLADSPHLGRSGRVEGTRELVVARIPYLVAYAVIGDQLVVLAVLHHAQDWPPGF